MRVFFILFLIIFGGINSAFAYDLILPKEKKTIVNSNYAFFIGKAYKSEEITINGERTFIAPNGAFAHTIKLKDGENRIVIKSNFATQIYKIYKNNFDSQQKNELIEMEPELYEVKKNNTPLRKTPIGYGMNRISHLFEGTNLIINGRKGNFYRVFLSKNKEAWIAKDAIALSNKKIMPEFISMDSKTFKNASKHTIEFTEKLPYTIEETSDEVIFKVYNPITSENSVYTINIKKPKKYTYKTELNNGSYVFKITQLPETNAQTLEGLTIVVDAGHGGSEKGALGCLGDKEKDINLKIALALKKILSQYGANVIMTRECDGNVSLEDRIKIARDNNSDIFISIHLNSIPDIKFDVHKNRGTSIYYYNENSKELAKSILEAVTKTLNTRNDGVKTASFAVLRPTDYIGILVEVAYMTNPLDSILYTKESFANDTAISIAEGLLNYINKDIK